MHTLNMWCTPEFLQLKPPNRFQAIVPECSRLGANDITDITHKTSFMELGVFFPPTNPENSSQEEATEEEKWGEWPLWHNFLEVKSFHFFFGEQSL